MAWSKIDELRIEAWCIKVQMGTPIEDIPEKYRDEVAKRVGQ